MCDCTALSAPPGECPGKAREHKFALNWGFYGLFSKKGRNKFKILLLTLKALHNLAPLYLIELLTPYSPSRSLRSS